MDACLSTGLCFGTRDGYANVLTRSGCTDRTFSDSNCPQVCIDVNPTGSALVFPVRPHSNVSNTADYCCGPFNLKNNGQCDDPTDGNPYPFPIPNANLITNRTTGEQGFLNRTSLGTASQATVTTVQTSTLAAATQDHRTKDLAIGAGVGVPLGVLLVLVCTVLALQMRRHEDQKSWVADIRQKSQSLEDFRLPQGREKAQSDAKQIAQGDRKSESVDNPNTGPSELEAPDKSHELSTAVRLGKAGCGESSNCGRYH